MSNANSLLCQSVPYLPGAVVRTHGFKIASFEDRVFETLRKPRMDVEVVSNNRPRQEFRLRTKDRVFACVAGDPDRLLWIELIQVHDSGYTGEVLAHSGGGVVVHFDISGCGTFDGSPIKIEAIDEANRLSPMHDSLSVSAYKAFRKLGLTTSFEKFVARRRPSTNQVFINAHRQAIVTLGLGQYFIAAGEVWLVSKLLPEGFVGARMRDHATAEYSYTGECLQHVALSVQAAIYSEADYDHDGWTFELDQYSQTGFPSSQIFHISPGSIAAALPGCKLVLNTGAGLQVSTWDVIGRSESDLFLDRDGAMGTLSLATGQGAGASADHQFLALIEHPKLAAGAICSMVRKVLLYA
jgi:hypothetical protein